MKAEIRVMCLQAKKQQKLTANHQKLREKHGKDSLSQLSEESRPANSLISDFKLPGLWDNKFLCLSHPAHGTLLQQPKQTNTLTFKALAQYLLT